MFWNKEIETASREDIEQLQSNRLKQCVKKVYENVPLYKTKFDEVGLKPEDISTVDDLTKIPFTVKDDLRDTYPFGMFAVPKKDVVRIHASSGTTGKPTVVGYTTKDLDMWSSVMARLCVAGGVSAHDTAQVAFGYGLFTGAFGLHYALEKIGVTVIPASSGNTEKQIMLMKDFGTTVLISTPSYALYISEVMAQMGIDPKRDLKLKYGLFGAEASTEEMRRELEERLGIVATENYGLSEIIGPGVSGECTDKCGMHINEDHFIVEIIDSVTGEVLPYGEEGEVVITAMSKEALPILRYKTKDISNLIPNKCSCGRTSMRMAKIKGRSDDMLVIRGVNVFPSQIETVLLKSQEVEPHYEIIVKRENWLDQLEVLVEIADTSLLENYSRLEDLQNRIKSEIRTILSIDANVKLVEPNTLKRFQGKAQRVTDLRDQ
ncbi:MAG: phenylacetate--CoA ligase [Clostridiales bacterium]|nr:phenylacetate--CoA ligase [Clostridiales bacterium]